MNKKLFETIKNKKQENFFEIERIIIIFLNGSHIKLFSSLRSSKIKYWWVGSPNKFSLQIKVGDNFNLQINNYNFININKKKTKRGGEFIVLFFTKYYSLE